MRSMTVDGVPFGAMSPIHTYASYPATPDSATVGTSGSCGDRVDPVTASGRSLPALMCPTMPAVPGIEAITCPARRSVVACPLPLYGTCDSCMPVIDASIAMNRCWPLPLPDDA